MENQETKHDTKNKTADLQNEDITEKIARDVYKVNS